MKNTFNWWLLLLAMAFVAACSSGGEDIEEPDVPPTPTQPTITLGTTASDFTTDGGSHTISFTASTAWTAEVINSRADAWCSVSPTSGKAGDAEITVTTKPNDTPDDRSASVIIKAGTTQKTINVSQKQKDALTVTSSKFEVEAEGGEVKIEVKANIDFEYTIDEKAKAWITSSSSRALKTSNLVFKVAANEETDKREATVTIKSGSFKEEVKIYQAGAKPSITLTKNEFVVSSAGDTIAVEVKSNVNVEVELPAEATWISENKSRAMSTNTYYFIIAESQEYDQREALIKFTNKDNGLSETVKVVQVQKDAIVVAKNEYEFGVDGASLDLEILTNVDVTVSIPDSVKSWITQVQSRGLVSKTLHFDIAVCSANDERSGTITLSGGNAKQTITIKQNGTVEINPEDIPDNEIWYTSVDGRNITFDYTGFESANLVSHVYKYGKGILTFDVDVETIPDKAFIDNDELTSIILPNKVVGIGNEAFSDCDNLRNIDFGNSLTTIGEKAFFWCDLRTVVIPSSVIQIYPMAFECCKKLTDVVINGSLDCLSEGAFRNCENLQNITLPSTLKEIHSYAFMNCYNLKKIHFPSSLKTIHSCAFINSGLEIVELPDSLVDLPIEAFHHCNTIKEFHGKYASDDLMFLSHEGYMFAYAVGAGRYEYSIPEGIKRIECYTFWSDKNINKIIFPSTIENISVYAFIECENLEYIYGPCTTTDNKCAVIDGVLQLFAGKGIKEYVLPECIREIGGGVFSYNKELSNLKMSDNVMRAGVDKRFLNDRTFFLEHSPNLKQITLSAKIHDLGYGFFYGCSSLETIYCRSTIPPTLSEVNITEGTPTPTIYVPEQSLGAYMASNDWIPFKDYIKGYNYTDLPEIDTYISSDYSSDGKVTTLQTATKGSGIDIILMGDAYSDRQIADGTYDTDMKNLYNNLFTEEPYNSFKDHFNVYYVNVVSATEGYEHNNTALSGYFGNGTLVGGNDEAVFTYAQKAISAEAMDEALLIVAMNSDNYAGTCYMYYPTSTTGAYGNGPSVAYFPKGGNAETFAQLLHHEACGHGFAKLADEYAYESMGAIPASEVTTTKDQQANWGWWKNVDFTNDTSAIRWSKFINDSRYANEGLGAYEGGLTYWSGVWRPTENSIMRYNTGGFNAPSREAIYYRIHKLAYGDSWEYDYEKFVEWDAINRSSTASRSFNYVEVPKDFEPLHAPVVKRQSWKDAK